MTFTDNGIPKTAWRMSEDNGENFEALRIAGAIGASDEPGFDTGAADDFAYLATNNIILETDDNDPAASKTGSTSTGTYAKSMWAYGKNTEADMVFATAAADTSTETMYRIETDIPTAITPNDGSFDGIVTSRNAIAMSRVSDDDIWTLQTFNTTVKLAYTDDRGDTWTIDDIGLTSGAKYIRVKNTNTEQVYIMDTAILKYSEDGGDNFKTDRVAPTVFGIGFEVR
jgi:hypothetical protein